MDTNNLPIDNSLPIVDGENMDSEVGNIQPVGIKNANTINPPPAENAIYASTVDGHPTRTHTTSIRLQHETDESYGQDAQTHPESGDPDGELGVGRSSIFNSDGGKEGDNIIYGLSIYIPSDIDILSDDFGQGNYEIGDLSPDGHQLPTERNNPCIWVDNNGVGQNSSNQLSDSYYNSCWSLPVNGISLCQVLTTTDSAPTNQIHSGIAQLHWQSSTGLVFDIMDNFEWNTDWFIPVDRLIPLADQTDKWIDIRFHIDVRSNDQDGMFKIYINNELLYERTNVRTIYDVDGSVTLAANIYKVKQQYTIESSVTSIYYDNIYRKISYL